MTLQNKISPGIFPYTRLFGVPLSSPMAEGYILLTWMLQCDSAPTLHDLTPPSSSSSSTLVLVSASSYSRKEARIQLLFPGNHFIPIISNLPTIGGVLCGYGARCNGYRLIVARRKGTKGTGLRRNAIGQWNYWKRNFFNTSIR